MKKPLQNSRFLRTLLLFFAVLSFSNYQLAQCTNSSSYGSATAPTTGTVQISTCSYQTEYSTINSVVGATIYQCAIAEGGFITIRQGSATGPVVASGASPLTWTSTVAGTYYSHWSTNSSCGTATNCVTTSVTYISPASACTDPITAGTTVSSTVNACLSQPFSLTLNGSTLASGLTYQWQSSPDGVTYTNISGAISSSLSTTQTAPTFYRCSMTCSGGTAVTSTPIQVGMNTFVNCYCSSAAQYTGDEDIINVSIGTLNNTSTCTTTGGTGSILGAYSNYTTSVAAPILAKTVNYNMSVGVGTCGGNYGNYTKVWIDFNQDGVFQNPGELVLENANQIGINGPNTVSGTITIPSTAITGTTRMRVVNSETTFGADVTPCSNANYYYGETEDYLVEIAPTPTCPQPTAFQWLSGTTTAATLAWTPAGSETEWTVEYGAPGFALGTGTQVTATTNPTITIPGLTPNSFFQAYVRAICSATDSSYNAGPIAFNTYGLGQYMEADVACGTGFTDISTIPAATNYNLANDGVTGMTLPFSFYYQGTVVNEMSIGNNGAIVFGSLTAPVTWNNTALTSAANGLYPFWDDMTTNGSGVYTLVTGTAPNRKVIVQWNRGRLTTLDPYIFQTVLDEATSEIYFYHNDVVSGNATYDNGANATVGVAGPNQDIQLSFNSATYLSQNACSHFYYTDCPKPKNLTFSGITTDEFGMTWVAGLSNEPEWLIEYGAPGFTAGTGTELTDITTAAQQIGGLTQITNYEVRIYALCANGDTSVPLIGNVTTLPFCADPFALAGTTDPDSLELTWNWTETISPITGFNIQYFPNGSSLYAANAVTVPSTNGILFNDTVVNPALMAGMTYKVYVQAVCGTDTSNFIGGINMTMPLTNDLVCAPEMLNTDGTVYTFTNAGATVSNSDIANTEQSIAPPATGLQTTTGWGNNQISFSTWFTFVAPPSGQVRISGKDAAFDGQMAVYEVGNCAQFSTFELMAANDNEIGGSSLSPNFTVCGLTPGSTYYLMHDSYSTFTTGTYSIKITPIVLEAGSPIPTLTQICTGDTTNLFETITGNDLGGVWTPVIPSVQLVQDSLFASAGLAYQTFNFQYRMTDGCAYDSTIASVKIFPPSSAGTDGSLVVCRNEPFNLLEGLDGTVDLGGTWTNPTGATVPNGNTVADNFPGQYNYQYIVGNGVCPNDTAKVIVAVQTCNYLGLDETAMDGFKMYPNPTDGLVYIAYEGVANVFNYEITDLNGRKVAEKQNAINGTSVTEIDLNNVENGIYMIRVFNANAQKTFRVIVK